MKRTRISVLGMNFVALAATFFSSHPAPAEPASSDASDAVGLNQASLQAIESAWLELPRHCKARGFNAEPITIVSERLSPEVAAIYQA